MKVLSCARSLRWGVALSLLLSGLVGVGPIDAQSQQYDPTQPFGSPVGDAASPVGRGSTRSDGYQDRYSTDEPRLAPASPADIAESRRDRDEGDDDDRESSSTSDRRSSSTSALLAQDLIRRPQKPSEFERYVEQRLGRKLPRFGADLVFPILRDFSLPNTATVPASYLLNVGDQISINFTGSTEGSIQATIDTDGRIFIPKVGEVSLVGVRYGDLRQTLTRAVSRQYRDFEVSVTIGRLRGIRVYVTGFANYPGAYTVSSLSTLINATFAAGGPSSGGSLRSIQLYRNGQLVSNFDLYDLLRSGDRSKDAVLQNQDVLYIPPVGDQVAIAGSINEEAIYEAKAGESLGDLLRYSGGLNPLADMSRIVLYRVPDIAIGGQEIAAARLNSTPARGGDLVQVLSVGTLAQSLERQAVLVRIEGEVSRPGNYSVAPGTTLAQAMELAGGTTSRAFVYGMRFERFSVRQQQRESFEEAINQLEVSIAATPIVGNQSIDAGQRNNQVAAAQAVVAKLRQTEPDGRMVLDIPYGSAALPGDLVLENNDRIVVPPRPTTVGVFGAVHRPASFLVTDGRALKVRDYIEKAGGSLRVADKGEIFLVRANGEVVSRRRGALGTRIQPGDVVFVPVRTQAGGFWARLRDIATTVLGFGVAAATISAID